MTKLGRVKTLSSVTQSIPPPVQVLLAIVSIQIGAALAIDLFDEIGPAGAVFCRLTISTLFLFLLIRPEFDGQFKKNYKLLLIYGATLAAMNWFFYESIARIPLGLAVTIEFMGPLLVAVITSHRRLDLLWITIAFAGLLILAPDIGGELDLIGVLFAVLAGIGWGSFVLLSKRVSDALPGNSGLVYGMFIASVLMLPFSFGNIIPVFSDVWLIGSVILLAIVSTTIPFFFEFSALKSLSPQTYGVLITLEPAVAATIGAVLLGDRFGFEGLIAIACVTIAAIGATLTQKH